MTLRVTSAWLRAAASSLTNRVFMACTLLAMLSLGFAFYFVNDQASAGAESELRLGLAEAGSLVDQHQATRSDYFRRLARVVADLPKLKAAVETANPPTVQPLAEEYRTEVNADLLLLTGRRGNVLGAAGTDPDALLTALPAAWSDAEISTFHPHAHGVLQVVSVPILLEGQIPDILGRLTVGVLLNDARAAELKGLTGSDIAFGADGRILASTLPADSHPLLAGVIGSTAIASVTIAGEEFLALARPLLDTGGGPVALILRSRTQRLQFLSTIRTRLVGVLVVTLLCATLLSYGVARTMTRPLAAITTAMRDIAATGDLTRKVSLKSRAGDDEDARVLATTFNALTESIARFQQEAAQKARLSALGRLSTVIAHEIRNPLMIIKASVASLRHPDVTPAEIQEAAADIEEETTRLNRIVTEVLDFARPIRFDLAEADVNELCRASADAAWAGHPDGAVAFDLDPAASRVMTDAERLRIALVNLLTNARHAVAAVDCPSPVTVRTRRVDGRVTISIHDRGAGITAEDMARIFDPYFTTRRAGTGLGLPIAKNIIEGLQGGLSVSSSRGAGTEIRIDLPAISAGGRA